MPMNGRAAVFNLTVVNPQGGGYLAVYPSGTQWAGTSSINWSAAGATVATLVISATGADNAIIVRGGVSTTNFVIDYVGSLT